MKKAIQFGAGNIGRGFIGSLLSSSGYHVVFADIDQNIIDLMNTNKKYLVEVVGEKVEKFYVENISAVSSLDQALIKEINEASIITTAVGPNVLDKIAGTIANGIKERIKNNNTSFLNIIACENMVGASDHLKEQVLTNLNEEEIKFLNEYIGFVNSAVDRIVPPMGENKEDDIHVMVEEFKEWIVDKTQFKGEIPQIEDMQLTDNLMAYVERKIFTLNTGHAITSYLGYSRGYNTIKESIMDENIEKLVTGAMEESGEVLVKKYGFDRDEHKKYIQKIIARFKNPYLNDEVSRVARQPLRKLNKDDRLIKPFIGTVEFDVASENLIKGIVYALSYNNPSDEDAVKIQNIIKESLKEAVSKITGLDGDSKVTDLIVEEYLKSNAI